MRQLPVRQGVHSQNASSDKDFAIEHHLYTPDKQKNLKVHMKGLYVKFHGFSKGVDQRARSQNSSMSLPMNMK